MASLERRRNNMDYVAGFLFNRDRSQVALILKNKPAWQVGKLNAIGGKIESGETAEEAMHREFREETGADISDWKIFATLICEAERHPGAPAQSQPYHVHFFRAFTNEDLGDVVDSKTDEQVIVWDYLWRESSMTERNYQLLPNLNWLIPMALQMCNDVAKKFNIIEVY
jgi:8-oxo-dGTP pyrophosphatase MutT (NUDIX family)